MYTPAFIFLGMSLFILIFGYLLRFKHKVEIIAGYDPKRVKDKIGLAKWVGCNLLILGIIGLIITAIAFILPSISLGLFFAFMGIIILGAIYTALHPGKFYSSD